MSPVLPLARYPLPGRWPGDDKYTIFFLLVLQWNRQIYWGIIPYVRRLHKGNLQPGLRQQGRCPGKSDIWTRVDHMVASLMPRVQFLVIILICGWRLKRGDTHTFHMKPTCFWGKQFYNAPPHPSPPQLKSKLHSIISSPSHSCWFRGEPYWFRGGKERGREGGEGDLGKKH